MNDGSITIYEKQDRQQDAFGWTDAPGGPTVQFSSAATVDREGITTTSESGGFTEVGDLTVFPASKPDFSEIEIGSEAEVETEEGDTITATVAELRPKGAFCGAIALDRYA